ncbi:S41 family peptidase [Undibacterium crateris]|uniref:S41 family peptidase n=1 Tax=Undibacterium crateris TaxID=2528175 RepID=UPI00138A426C|nr:S41 family peptidase [Undibacterium crateris]NDI86259.1 peptidase S41 [Undibacterium crateris]
MKQYGVTLGLLALLTACGGGGGGGGTDIGGLPSSESLANLCANPRAGSVDRQGTMDNEKAFLRSFVDETYLWYKDVPTNLNPASYANPQLYFDVLKTTAKTASGVAVDQFHWSQTTESYEASSSGISQDYGIQWGRQSNSPPRNWVVIEVAAGSPAATAGIKRGDKLTSVDGVNFVTDNSTAGIATLNEGLFPTKLLAHKLGFNGQAEISMTPATYSIATVKNTKVIPTVNGNVGYFIFDTHIAKSENELISAINTLKNAGVQDLVIDLRYNGGGLLYIASQLSYMIAGPAQTGGKIFELMSYNDKLTANNKKYPFYDTTSGNASLPTLGLKHVTLLVSQGTASASESIINGLRGADVAVDLIGDTTRGKPYGFVPQSNCGYTYFAIQFKGVNNKGFGDYADGFAPTCKVADDLTKARGDITEGMLRTALGYRQTGACPVVASVPDGIRALPALEQSYELVRPASQEMRIVTPMPRS